MSGPPPPTSYNKIFEKLVPQDDADDLLVGLIAYGLYKRNKRDWIINYKKTHDNNPPSSQEEIDYEEYNTDQSLKDLKRIAESMLTEYADYVIASETPEIREKAIIESKNNFWGQLGIGLLGNFIFAVIILLLFIYAHFNGSDLAESLGSKLKSQPKIEEPKPSNSNR